MELSKSALTARAMLETLKRLGVTHMVWLPDTESGDLFDAFNADPDIALVPVTREGETFAIALGLLIGGKKPIVCIQNTGFYESGDSIRGIWLDLNLPIMSLVGYRGYEGGAPSKDSAATFLEPTLKTWGVPYKIVRSDADVVKVVPELYRQASERPGPTAVLIGGEYEG
ncbi:MAG: thiamine pyrophosphate-binding protein [Chloroflexota bacterium]